MSNKEEKKPAPKKDEFTNYLEKSGVVDNLSDVLIHLYAESERPKFPTEYIKSNLKSSSTDENAVIEENNMLREENKQLQQRVSELERLIERMKKSEALN